MSTRKRYTKEFKIEVLRLWERSDRFAAEIVRELGIRRNQLYKWCHECACKGAEKAFRGPGRAAMRPAAL